MLGSALTLPQSQPAQQQHRYNGGGSTGSHWHTAPLQAARDAAQHDSTALLLQLPDVTPFDDTATSGSTKDSTRDRKRRRREERGGLHRLHHKHKHRKHKHRSKPAAHDGEGSRKRSRKRRDRKDRKDSRRSRRARSEQSAAPPASSNPATQPATETPPQQQLPPAASPPASAAPAVSAASAAIEQWVASWAESSAAAVRSKVADKVSREWAGKDRTGVVLHEWLTANPKRKQQAHALLAVYEKKQRRGANSSNGSHH